LVQGSDRAEEQAAVVVELAAVVVELAAVVVEVPAAVAAAVEPEVVEDRVVEPEAVVGRAEGRWRRQWEAGRINPGFDFHRSRKLLRRVIPWCQNGCQNECCG
jgi:hypothetical protein